MVAVAADRAAADQDGRRTLVWLIPGEHPEQRADVRSRFFGWPGEPFKVSMPRVIADRKFSCFDVRMMIARLGVVRAKLSSRLGPR